MEERMRYTTAAGAREPVEGADGAAYFSSAPGVLVGSLSANALNADLVASTDVSGYDYACLLVAGTWSGTLTFQGSNDNSTWQNVSAVYWSTSTVLSITAATTSNNHFTIPIIYKYLRVRMTGYSSGPATGTIMYYHGSSFLKAITGTVGVNALPTPTAHTLTSAATTNATSIKASAGTLYNITVTNTGAATGYLKLYNKASAPSVGTDVPVLTIPVATNGTEAVNFGALGQRLGTGIAIATTLNAADNDNTGIGAGEMKIMTSYV